MPVKHYTYGGSTAQRTIACPSWVAQSQGIPQGESSEYANTGTMLHDQMERLLNATIDEWEVTDPEQVELLNMALAAWDELCKRYKVVDYWTEQTYELNPETGGTADVVAVTADNRLIIVDWKFGQGIAVPAVGNVQGMFYAMVSEGKIPTLSGFVTADIWMPPDLTLAIIQPIPTRDDNETLKIWDVPSDIYETFKQTYIAAQKATGLNAGGHCRWCPAAATCPEKTGEALKALTMDPAKLDTLAASLNLADDVIAWAKQVKDTAHTQMELGNAVTGWKLVQKRATRKWTDDGAAEEAVRDAYVKTRKLKVGEITEASFLSAPKLEKVFKKKGIDFDGLSAYVCKTSSGSTLAREDDPREGIMSANALKHALGRLT